MRYTVITATFNSEKTVARTFNSILNQSNKNIEYIVVDGKSTDNTISIIKTYASKFKASGIVFKWISEKDTGIYDAWNKGLKIATGKWISFLGSDDVYSDNAIELYHNFIDQQDDELDLVYSNINVVKGDKILRTMDGVWSWKVFRRKMNIAHVGTFHNSNYFKTYGMYNSDYKIAGDYELLLRAGEKLKTAKFDSITALMAYGGISNNMIFQVFSESVKAKNETGKVNIFVCYFDFLKEYLIYLIKKVFY